MAQGTLDSGGNRLDAVVDLASRGKTDREIAETLGISPHTVDTYWKRLRGKWNAKTRAEVVVAHLREAAEVRDRETAAEIGRLRTAEAAARAETARLETLTRNLTERLRESQRQEAARSRLEPTLAAFERATTLNLAVAYELSSVHPVLYSFYSASSRVLGIDPQRMVDGESTFYDVLHPDDLREMLRLIAAVRFLPGERRLFLYRALVPEPRWFLDCVAGRFEEGGAFTGLTGLAVDVHDLVLAGLLQPKVAMIEPPSPSRPPGA